MKTELILIPENDVSLRQILQMSRDGWDWTHDTDDDVLIFWRCVNDAEVRR